MKIGESTITTTAACQYVRLGSEKSVFQSHIKPQALSAIAANVVKESTNLS